MSDIGSDSLRGIEITLESPRFECDRLHVAKLAGTLAISRAFAIDLDVVCVDAAGIDVASVLGEDVTIVFTPRAPGDEAWSGVQRIHGMVGQVDERLALALDRRAYRFQIVPRLERLSLTSAPEVFLGRTVPELIRQKLASVNLVADAGAASDVLVRLDGTYEPREFVVQYGETDLAFISRLAEHLGICFFFVHDGDVDQIVLTDNLAGFAGEAPRLPFGVGRTAHNVFELDVEHRRVPKRFTVHDYNYRTPHVAIIGDTTLDVGYAGDVVEYGANTKSADAAKHLARVRAEEHATRELVYVGASTIPALRPGLRVRVEHPEAGALDLLVVEVTHTASQAHAGGGAERGTYANTFRAIPGDRMYRPARLTPRPKISGLINGVIDPGLGNSGDIAQLDNQGRYRVRLLFDTTDRHGTASSHPMRMLQNHAGENYGTHFPLKPGIEVLVGFLDGDPDRPIIVGAAANPLTPSPVTDGNAPVHRTRSVTGVIIDFT